MRPPGRSPCRSVRQYREDSAPDRFLTPEELVRLGRVLDTIPNEGLVTWHAAMAIRLLVLTGCRKNEILTLRWEDVDLEAGEIHLKDAKTGPRPVALSPSAVSILKSLQSTLRPDNPWVIASRRGNTHLVDLNRY